MARVLLLFSLLVLFIAVLPVAGKNYRLDKNVLPRKQLAGPPSEFSLKQLPQTSDGAQDAQSAFFQVKLTSDSAMATKVAFVQPLPVDSPISFAFSVFSPFASQGQLQLNLADPKGNNIDLSKYATSSSFPIGDSGTSVPSTTYSFDSPVTGTWVLSGSVPSEVHAAHRRTITSSAADLVVLLWNSVEMKMYSQLNTYSMLVGQPIGMNACVYNATKQSANWRVRHGRPALVARDNVQFAEMNVLFPDGVQRDFAMHDDGMHSDGLANDGVFGADFKAPVAGVYWAQAFVRGKNPLTGADYIRTSQHLLRVMPANVQLQPTSTAKLVSNNSILKFEIDAKFDAQANVSDELIGYAEVWATSKTGTSTMVPVAWIGGAVDVEDESTTSPHVDMYLDLRWLSIANAAAPFELRNVRIQNQLIPITQIARISVALDLQTIGAKENIRTPAKPTSISREMRQGKPPAVLFERAARADALRSEKNSAISTPSHALLLVHGYCAQIQPFENQFATFTDAVLFEDFGQSRTNDAFAQKIAEFATDENFASFATVAHSQGGLATLHLHAYYWTNLELATGGRVLQSVGSPYQGSAIAGSSANLGKAFGVGCGENFDLTHDGAALWLSGINSTAVLDDVYYYTTQYQTGSFINYCSLPTNLILKWPNDGVVELDYAPLPGNAGHNMGHTLGECHTADMQWPPQCWDLSRDQQINANAAR